MTATDVVEGKHETTCTCSCGWSLTTTAASPELASQIAAKAKANHLADVHPRQLRSSIATAVPAPAPVPVIREAFHHGHTPFIDAAVKHGILWHRTLQCSCGWGAEVDERTPFQADKALRSQHRKHVGQETDRAPLRDYVLLLGLIAVVMTICFVLASTAIDVSV